MSALYECNASERQIEYNLSKVAQREGPAYTPLVRQSEDEVIKLNIDLVPKKTEESETTEKSSNVDVADKPPNLISFGPKKAKHIVSFVFLIFVFIKMFVWMAFL